MALVNPITEPQLPQTITRDSELSTAINAHISATDPHPTYLTQSEGDARYKRSNIKEVFITGTVKSTAGDTAVVHEIPASATVVGLSCTVTTTANWKVPPGFVNTTFDYFVYATPTHFIIYVPGSGANSGGVMGRPFNALITYT